MRRRRLQRTAIAFVERKMRRKTPRISPGLWDRHRDQITTLYHYHSLGDVMNYMKKKERGLEDATKRQYIHCFQKWGIYKYRTQKTQTPRGVSSTSPVDTASTMSIDDSVSAETTSVSDIEAPSVAHSNAMIHQWIRGQPSETRNSGPGDAGWAECQMPPMTQVPVIQFDGSFNHDQDMLAADLCFSISDDRHASVLFRSAYNTLQEQEMLSPSFATKLTVNFCRCLQTPGEAKVAQEMIKENLHHLSASAGPVDRFLSEALYARTFDTTAAKSRDEGTRRIVQIVEGIISQGRLRSLPQRGLALDLVTFQCLHYVVVRYNESKPQEWHINVNGILQQFLQQAESNNIDDHGRRSPLYQDVTCVRRCLEWCDQKLKEELKFAPLLHEMAPEQDSDTEAYKEDLKVLAYLWQGWQDSRSTGDESSSSWEKTAETELGISATELLTTITWMLTSRAPAPRRTPHGAAEDELLACASQGAEKLASSKDSELLWNFLHRFLSMNSFVPSPPAEQQFRDGALSSLRGLAERVLNVEIPSPKESSGGPSPANPNLSIPMESEYWRRRVSIPYADAQFPPNVSEQYAHRDDGDIASCSDFSCRSSTVC